jgi:hypothetical protein
MTMAVKVSTISTGAHQNPITLCQLKSRALPRRPERNHVTADTCFAVH